MADPQAQDPRGQEDERASKHLQRRPEYISQMEKAKQLYKKPPEEPGSASCEVELIQTSATLLDSGSSSSMISATREGEPALPRIKDEEVWLQELREAQGGR